MKNINMKIGTQLKIGFATVLFFVFILGFVSYLQNGEMQQQTEDLYKHPLLVRRTIGLMRADLIAIHRDMKDLILATNENETAQILNSMELFKASAFEQIDNFYINYLGPRTDIDSLKRSFITWNSLREEIRRLLREGKKEDAIARSKTDGIVDHEAKTVLKWLEKIDAFAKNKGDELYNNSEILKMTLNRQLIYLVALITLLSLIINYYLFRNIRNPLDDLAKATQRFHNGDLSARSSYISKNEFGLLCQSFNTLAESLQTNNELKQNAEKLAGIMLSGNDAKKFFHNTLNALSEYTDSQIAAVYFLSGDKKYFEHFYSIGIEENARQSFSAENYEGEFGSVLASRKMQRITNSSDDTRFLFTTVSGKFIPREIITIPILVDNEVIAVISLASISMYNKKSIKLIENILDTFSARIEGILAYRKIIEFSETLGYQNRELEAQKTELASQSAEVMEQNAELEVQKQQLNDANHQKTVFLSNMSHELRTPLNSVIALSGVLNRRLANKIPEDEYQYLEVIERNGKHLLSLINDILDLSRIEAGREEIESAKFNVTSLISEVIDLIAPLAVQKNIELIHLLSNDSKHNGAVEELFIASDAAKLRHILQNLIGNSVKFTETGRVEVSAELKNDKIAIKVFDTGIGIADEHLTHIFDEFRQADGSTSRRFGGTGLGLAIAKRYANLLGGFIAVKSTLGEGSTFTLTLPAHSVTGNKYSDNYTSVPNNSNTYYSDSDKPIPEVPSYPAANKTIKTILIVEDSEPAIIQIKDILEETGHKILVANNGETALEIIATTTPDAMILDLMMPGIDGFQVLKSIREVERTAHVPVLILTAKQITKDDLKLLTKNNIHQLIQKGNVNRKELLNAVTAMILPASKIGVKPVAQKPKIEGKPVVLVVEDNPDNMLTVKALLGNNYSVIEAVDGVEGVELAKKQKPDLILMDIALPIMDGILAFKWIRHSSELQNIPVIALTASAMTHDRETILAYGFDAYIAKPIDEKLFFTSINEILYGK